MWGTAQPRPYHLLTNVRAMITSSAGHDIIYAHGGKDDFQVCILENGYAYPMGDVDYFTVVLQYSGRFRQQIYTYLSEFARSIDTAAGGFYDTFESAVLPAPQQFDIQQGTFGYDSQWLKANLLAFKSEFAASGALHTKTELEEALSIIFLAMVSEWYYGFDYQGNDTGRRSKWQHRIKLLGLYQVISGQLSPQCASRWSYSIPEQQMSAALRQFRLYDQPYKLIR